MAEVVVEIAVVEVSVEVFLEIGVKVPEEVVDDICVDESVEIVVGTDEVDIDCVVVFAVDVVVFDVIGSCDSVVVEDVVDAVEDVGNVEEVVFSELVVNIDVVFVEAADSASDMMTGVVTGDEVDTLSDTPSVDITETVD